MGCTPRATRASIRVELWPFYCRAEIVPISYQSEGAERRILVPGCDGVGGSAGEPCLSVCLSVCLFRVGRGLLALPSTK